MDSVRRSNSIWAFHNRRNKMIGVYNVGNKGKLERRAPNHPHCLNSVTGDMCLGNSTSLLQLLLNAPCTGGIAVSNSSLYEWYNNEFNHRCEKLEQWARDHEIIELEESETS